ncbi:hypothetical protein NDU88_007459 [Pleurodeles waltl]|uniref:Uncharacterized protein n=1 Tax=Pleurodeles waltl TaxID=8319 RepID=A0AAV7VPT7_PLEWA|nr:hypothetical protein NDU88_007459 [Pleurodeles waltl]
MGLSSEPGCPESQLPSSSPRVQPAPYTDRLGTLGPFGDGLLGQPRLLFQAKSFHPARDRPTRRPAVSRRPFLAERRPSSPPVCAPSSGSTRVEWGRVAPGPGKPPPAVRAPECHHPPTPPSAFSPAGQNDRSVGCPRRSRLAGTPASPAQAALRPGRLPPAEVAGARRFPCDRPVLPLRWGAKDGPRQARGYPLPSAGAATWLILPVAYACLKD